MDAREHAGVGERLRAARLQERFGNKGSISAAGGYAVIDYHTLDAIAAERDALVARVEELEAVCEKAIRERRSLEVKEDDWHSAYERSEARVATLKAALREYLKDHAANSRLGCGCARCDRAREALEGSHDR